MKNFVSPGNRLANPAAPQTANVIDLVSSSDDEGPIFPSGSAALQPISSRGSISLDNDSEVQILISPTNRKRPSTVLPTSSATKNSGKVLDGAKRARINLPNQPFKFEPVGFGEADDDEITEVLHPTSQESTTVNPQSTNEFKSNSLDVDDEIMVIDSGKHSIGAMDMPHQRGIINELTHLNM
jgi:hypothetical protein